MLEEKTKAELSRQHYKIVGAHSAVKPCLWLKKALRGEGFCYKQKFYGIESHRCMQMTPALSWCTHACLFCWRNTKHTSGPEIQKPDDPEYIIDESIKAHKKAISGFGGSDAVDPDKFKKAQKPNQVAISLSGEPMAYPEMGELIEGFKRRQMTVYLVTNGTYPERIKKLSCLPTNLYLSVVAPDRETHKRVCAPLIPDAWERICESLDIFPSLTCTKIARLTAVKGLNMCDPKGYAKLMERAQPDYIEVKAYMHVGFARQRLSPENMPTHSEVKEFARQISEEIGYTLKDEKTESRVILLSKK
jgi:tRNA wybutosine-synthesizing protein 1